MTRIVMKRIRPADLINSAEYVREPVDKEIDEILSSDKKRIIVYGHAGVGKTTVLEGLEKRGLGNKEQTIRTRRDAVVHLSIEPNKIYTKQLFDYYFELLFVQDLLYYVSNNYPLLFDKYFKEDRELIYNLLDTCCDEINNFVYNNGQINTKYGVNDLTPNIVSKIKDILELDKLNIAIDRYDEINGSSEYVQNIYKQYFKLFDKAIITSEDPKINKDRLTNDGYDIKEISYGNNKDVLKEIIKRRIDYINSDSELKINEKLFLSDYSIDKLIVPDGNINLSLEILRYAGEMFTSNYPMSFKKLMELSVNRMNYEEKIQDQRRGRKKLYL